MQMKKINLLHDSEVVATQNSRLSVAPPLPPRVTTNCVPISGSQQLHSGGPLSSVHDLHSNSDDPFNNDDDSSALSISPHKSAPMPKPIPPPYRQPPPLPASALQYAPVGYTVVVNATSRLNNETISVPGSSDVDPTYVTHSAKFPVKVRRELMRHPHVHQQGTSIEGGPKIGATTRIPRLSEVFQGQQQRARMANVVNPDTGVKHRVHQAWLTDEPVAGDHIVRRSMCQTQDETVDEQTMPAMEEGESLLIQARSSRSSYPVGLDNYNSIEPSYIPSQAHQRPPGSFARGQLLLERRPEVVHCDGGDNLYRAEFVTSGIEAQAASTASSNIYSRGSAGCNVTSTIHSMQDLMGSVLSIHSAAGRLQLGNGDGKTINMTKATSVLPSPQQFLGSSFTTDVIKDDDSVQGDYEYDRYYHLKDMQSGQMEGVSVDEELTPAVASVSPDHQSCDEGQHQQSACNHTTAKGEDGLHQMVMPNAKNIAPKIDGCRNSTKYIVNGVISNPSTVEPSNKSMDENADKGPNERASRSQTGENLNHSFPEELNAEWMSRVDFDVKLQKPKQEQMQQQTLMKSRGTVGHDNICQGSIHESTFSDSFSETPPLPPLSPPGTPPSLCSRSPGPCSDSKRRLSQSAGNLHQSSGTTPDILETTRKVPYREMNQRLLAKSRHASVVAAASTKLTSNKSNWTRSITLQQSLDNRTWNADRKSHDGEVTSTTTGMGIDSLLGDSDVSTDVSSQTSQDGETGEMCNIRRQLEGLETMYAEVMRILGVKDGPRLGLLGGHRSLYDLRPSRRKGFGSSTSLSRGKGAAIQQAKEHNGSRINERKHHPRELKGVRRRFQRLESHVVTLARSVAHLSSEMRTHHVMFGEMESLRHEVTRLNEWQQVRGGALKSNVGGCEWENFRSSIPSLTNPTRVKKLTKFFGDEPPLLRLFLKKLGYEKYAPQFEKEKIGIIELPYLTEDRLQKIGIPTGPRMRILQEAQMSFRQEHFNIYIV